MSMRKGILLCCWLALAACSSEAPDGDEDAYDYEDEEYSEPAAEEPTEPPTARVMLDGETFELTGEGFCRRIGSTQTFGPGGRFEIGISTEGYTMNVSVFKDSVDGLRISFRKDTDGWEETFTPEEDPSQFDGRRFTFEGTVMKNLYRDQTTTMRVEVDCPFVQDLTV